MFISCWNHIHRAIDYFLMTKFPYKQIIEFPSGLSPRGMTFSENPEYLYIESDLENMLNRKKNIVDKIYSQNKINKTNHKFVSANLLEGNLEEKIFPHIDKNEKSVVITEGLTPYFDMGNLRKILTNIYKLLKNSGRRGLYYRCIS